MQHRPLTALLVALATTAAYAQGTTMQSPQYKECVALAGTDPAKALTKSEAWIATENGVASQHCRAMSLYGLRRFDEAAETLGAVREGIAPENVTLRSYLATQAASAWVSANKPNKGSEVLSKQIDDNGRIKGDNVTAAKATSGLLLERARITITTGKPADATRDLDHAISLTPINEDVLLERAQLFEQLGDKALARNDAEIVLKLNPKNTKAKAMLGLPAKKSVVKKTTPASQAP
jgi:tetratricopeptide (TPR) repeat protein